MNPIDEDEGNGFEFNDIIDEIAINEPTIGEVKSAIQRMKNRKSPRGITLLSVVGKILGRIIIDRVRNGMEWIKC